MRRSTRSSFHAAFFVPRSAFGVQMRNANAEHRTPNVQRRMHRTRRGTTLAESLIASVLLATCVVGITGALSASYQNQAYASAQRAASVSGRKMMENVLALPMDPATAGQASIADYLPAASQTTATCSTSALSSLLSSLTFSLVKFPAVQVTTPSTSVATASTSSITIDRRSTLNGTKSTTGDFAVVTVSVPAAGTSSVKFKRLVTSVETTANLAN